MAIKDDERNVLEWMRAIESEKGRVRYTDIYPRLREWLNRVSPSEILDIGCGQGICSDKIDLRGRHYTGIEPSPLLVERAKQLYRDDNRHFIVGNIYDLPFSNGAHDAAFSVSVWHLLENLERAASELSRVLKPKGHFLIITANPGGYSLWTDRYADTKSDGRRFEGTVKLEDGSELRDVLYLHTLDEIRSSLEAADLELQKTETFRAAEKSDGQKYYLSIEGRKVPTHSLPGF